MSYKDVEELTSEHAYSDASTVALGYGGGHLGPQGVLNTHQAYEGEILLHLVGGILLPTPLLPLHATLEGNKKVPVSDGQGPATQQASAQQH